jgi:hypothetical protein
LAIYEFAEMGTTKGIVLVAALAVHVGCGDHEQRQQRGAAGTAPSKKVTETLDSKEAQRALADYVEAHPQVFVSPGLSEKADELREVSVPDVTSGLLSIGRFNINLDKKTYLLIHWYGEPGKGWFENWIWQGSFQAGSNEAWTITKPRFTKEWGE